MGAARFIRTQHRTFLLDCPAHEWVHSGCWRHSPLLHQDGACSEEILWLSEFPFLRLSLSLCHRSWLSARKVPSDFPSGQCTSPGVWGDLILAQLCPALLCDIWQLYYLSGPSGPMKRLGWPAMTDSCCLPSQHKPRGHGCLGSCTGGLEAAWALQRGAVIT
jgi:hypothetical protein